jgi:hypothetical protein
MNSLRRWCVGPPGRLFGFERSTIHINEQKYMDRWIVYFGFGTLRLHKFYRGDDDRASHTHPWWFVTFPLSAYIESVYAQGVWLRDRTVRAWRPHFRSSKFEHIVLRAAPRHCDGNCKPGKCPVTAPFWTIVLSGQRVNAWGFYPMPRHFIPWREYR